MAEEFNEDEWEKIMEKRMNEIVDNSNDLYDIFVNQGKKDEKIVEIHQNTNYFEDISRDEVLYVAETLSNLIYATPLYENFFYVHEDEEEGHGREVIFFSSYDELQEYREKNNNCQFLCLRFRDIITLKNFLGLDTITVFLTNYLLHFSKENIDSFYDIYAYENTNNSSNLIIGQPSESYEKGVELLTPKFKEYDAILNVWLYHVIELKNKSTRVVDNKYEEMYDAFVVEMKEENYINIRDYINKIIKETNNHEVKVVLYNSDLGMQLLNTNTKPIYTKA